MVTNTSESVEAKAAEEKKDTRKLTDAEVARVSTRTGDQLKDQERRTIKLYQHPPGSTDQPLPDETVSINGYTYQIKRGVPVEVPESVAQVLEQAGRV